MIIYVILGKSHFKLINMKNSIIKTEIDVKDSKIGVMRVGDIDYISLTDLAKYQNSKDPSFTVKNWLRKISTIDYVGLWEHLNNNNFFVIKVSQGK